jgi:hypothetical protein
MDKNIKQHHTDQKDLQADPGLCGECAAKAKHNAEGYYLQKVYTYAKAGDHKSCRNQKRIMLPALQTALYVCRNYMDEHSCYVNTTPKIGVNKAVHTQGLLSCKEI